MLLLHTAAKNQNCLILNELNPSPVVQGHHGHAEDEGDHRRHREDAALHF